MTTALTTAALTILGGLTLLVLGQIIIRTFIDPAYELRKLRGEIANALIYHASTYMASDEGFTTDAKEEARDAFRSLGSQLEAKSYVVPLYQVFAFIRAVPTLDSIEQARGNLIGLSNSVLSGQVGNSERHRDAIIKALKLRISD
jgi:hypothetical protein